MKGACGVGMRLKSGQMTLLKTCVLSAAMVPGSAEMRIGSVSWEAMASTMSGSAATWSRCEWVRRTSRMPRISGKVRSPTPVPASTRTSPSIRKDVVRQSLAIAPEQPSTRTFIQRPLQAGSLGLERGRAVPARVERQQPHRGYTFGVQLVKVFLRVHPLQIQQIQVALVPVLGPVRLEESVPGFQLVGRRLGQRAGESKRVEDADRLLLALDPDPVQFEPRELRRLLAGRLADHDVDAI